MEKSMGVAIALAKKAYSLQEVPIGAVVYKNNEIVGRGFNQKEGKQNALYHAELIALDQAARNLGTWHLEDCQMFVTLEPCAMCAGAMLNMRLGGVFIGARDYRMGACGTAINLLEVEGFNHHIPATFGVREEECSELLSSFFQMLRKRKIK